MKTIDVVAAIIKENNKIFAVQRGYGEFKDYWEFPGGKVEQGESKEEALKREILEELKTEISVDSFLEVIDYDYPTFHLHMDCFLCSIIKGDLVLIEHESASWLTKKTLYSVEWLPADLSIIDKIEKLL